MKSCFFPLFLASFLFSALSASEPEILFLENFEGETALDHWEIESTNTGRVRIAEDPLDPSNRGLLMDDSTSNAVFSQNIARTSVSIDGYSSIRILVGPPFRVSKSEPFALTVVLDPIPSEAVELTLLKSERVHGAATYPAGASVAELTFPDFENNSLQGDRSYSFLLTDGYFSSRTFSVLVEETGSAGLSLSLPETLMEGASGTGEVSVSVERDEWVNIYLESSDPSVLEVPETVGLHHRNSSASFSIDSHVDPRVLGDQEIAITARIGRSVTTEKVIITERNSLAPVMSGPTEIVEGSADVEYGFALDGISDDELIVFFAITTPAETEIEPESAILKPGENQGTFKVSVSADPLVRGDLPFLLTAMTNTGESGVLEGRILADTVTEFLVDFPEKIEADAPYSVSVKAANESGTIVTSFEGVVNIYQRDAETGEETLLTEDVRFARGEATVLLKLPYSAHGSLLVTRLNNEIESLSKPLFVFANLSFSASDIVYDSARGLLYAASGGAAAEGYLHSVTPVDPNAAVIGAPLFLGGDPRRLVITDDKQFLYVGLWSAHAVQRVDLESFAADANISLDGDGALEGTSYIPDELHAVPGDPFAFLVSQVPPGGYFGTQRHIRLYVDGQKQPQTVSSTRELVRAGSSDAFYSVESQGLARFILTPDGYERAGDHRSYLFTDSFIRITGGDDLIFSTTGTVVDGLNMATVADLQAPHRWINENRDKPIVICLDADFSRVYYARDNTIIAYDTGTFQQIGTQSIPGIGNILRMVRWGDTGLALLTDNAELVLFEDKYLVPNGGPPTDLSVTIAASPSSVSLSGELTYRASVENKGNATASDVRLLFGFSEGQSLQQVSSGDFNFQIEGRQAVVEIGEVLPGVRHEISVTVVPASRATVTATVSVQTSSKESNQADNTASILVNVGFDSSPDSVNLINIPVNDVLFEPVSGELVLSVGAGAPFGMANRVVSIDPTSGLMKRSIAIPAEPTLLALSDDGTTAYVLNGGRNVAFRVDLLAEQVLESIAFTEEVMMIGRAESIAVVPGTTDSLVAGITGSGVRVYDKGVMRPEIGGSYKGDQIVLLPKPSLIFAYNSKTSNRQSVLFELTEDGVSAVAEAPKLFRSSGNIKGDGYFVYGIHGNAVRADLMTIDGNFSMNDIFPHGSRPTGLEPERASQRVYYSGNRQITSFDSESYLPIRTQGFDDLPSNIASLERWGKDGFTARLENSELAIFRSNLVAPYPTGIDLIVLLPDGMEVAAPEFVIAGNAFSGNGIEGVTVEGKSAASADGFANWSVKIDALAEGENEITITATASGMPAESRTITRTVYYVPEVEEKEALLADSWVLEHFGDLDSPLADPELDLDGDGRSNLAEFLFGTDPLVPDSPHLVALRTVAADGFYLFLEFIHRDSDSFVFAIESSSDLVIWKSFTGEIERLRDPVPVVGKAGYVKSTYRLRPYRRITEEFYRIRAEPK